MNTKNSIIYEPGFIILNPELLTSLCLYYYQIVIHGHKTLEKELSQILYERVIYLRCALKDELTEFKSHILQLYKSTNIQNEQDVLNEIDMLINTKLKDALLDMKNNIKSRIFLGRKDFQV